MTKPYFMTGSSSQSRPDNSGQIGPTVLLSANTELMEEEEVVIPHKSRSRKKGRHIKWLNKMSNRGWAALGALLTTTTMLIAVYRGYSEVIPAYDMRLFQGEELSISLLEPDQIRLSFHFKAQEYGNANNEIMATRVRVEDPSLPSTSYVRLNTSSIFTVGDMRTYRPVIVAGAEANKMECKFLFRLSDMNGHSFSEPGLRRLIVDFEGKDKKDHPVTFCFRLTDFALNEIFQSGGRQITFLNDDLLCSAK